jgi:hypothetical protein
LAAWIFLTKVPGENFPHPHGPIYATDMQQIFLVWLPMMQLMDMFSGAGMADHPKGILA